MPTPEPRTPPEKPIRVVRFVGEERVRRIPRPSAGGRQAPETTADAAPQAPPSAV